MNALFWFDVDPILTMPIINFASLRADDSIKEREREKKKVC